MFHFYPELIVKPDFFVMISTKNFIYSLKILSQLKERVRMYFSFMITKNYCKNIKSQIYIFDSDLVWRKQLGNDFLRLKFVCWEFLTFDTY